MKRLPVIAALAVVALVAGCSNDDGGAGDVDYGSQDLAPAEAPSGWQHHQLGGVTLATPSTWSETDAPSVEGESSQGWAFVDAELSEGGNTNGLTVIVSPEAGPDMLTQVEDSMVTAERTMGATDGSAEEIAWPGASDAASSTYLVQLPVGSDDGETIQFESLALALPDGQQAFLLVYGPQETFDDAAVHDVLASATVS